MTTQHDLVTATEDLCSADPLMAAVRRELGRIENLSTADGGWAPTRPAPVVYRLYANRDANKIVSDPLIILTTVLRFCTQLLEGDVPAALMMVSSLLANPETSPVPVTDAIRGHIQHAMSEGAAPTGYERYALGVASQAVGINAEHPNAEEIMRSGDFLDNPAVHAVWYTRALAVDNRVWDYVREQGGPTVCVTIGPDEPLEGANPLGDALIRLVSAMDQP